MRIPSGPEGTPAEGHPTLRASMIRAYGLDHVHTPLDLEQSRGCPLRYSRHYLDGETATPDDAYPLWYGTVAHAAIEALDTEFMPADAIEAAIAAVEPPGALIDRIRAEALADLDRWQPTPHSIAAREVELVAPLGQLPSGDEVWIAGRLDAVSRDGGLAVIDYKTDRRPPDSTKLDQNVQMMLYALLASDHYDVPPERVVVVYDAIKYQAIAGTYTTQTLDRFVRYLLGLAWHIQTGTDRPRVNAGCNWCPYNTTCTAWPEEALADAAIHAYNPPPDDAPLDVKVEWEVQARQLRTLLGGLIDTIDADIATACTDGPVVAGGYRFEMSATERAVYDPHAVVDLLGDDAWTYCTVAKGRLDAHAKSEGLDLSAALTTYMADPTLKRRRQPSSS